MATKRFAILGERESTAVKIARVLLLGAATTFVFVTGLAIIVVAVTE
ncbi:MAG: hypothetical protein RMA76_44710 [Deltaproteobacteria bacterium]|jgi:hypothetical protein